MKRLMQYSRLFCTIHDEQFSSPRQKFHFSVFSTFAWHDDEFSPLDKAKIHRFAVIWNGCHDRRIITFIERSIIKGVFSPVMAISECERNLTIHTAVPPENFVAPQFEEGWQKLNTCISGLNFELSIQCESPDIFDCDRRNSTTFANYLYTINMLWDLGLSTWKNDTCLLGKYERDLFDY